MVLLILIYKSIFHDSDTSTAYTREFFLQLLDVTDWPHPSIEQKTEDTKIQYILHG